VIFSAAAAELADLLLAPADHVLAVGGAVAAGAARAVRVLARLFYAFGEKKGQVSPPEIYFIFLKVTGIYFF
jgi:hypothetical protein